MSNSLLFGTNNPHKLREIREILQPRFTILGLGDLDTQLDVAETEPTLEGNAMLKARAFYDHTGIPCFADDTGLEVQALEGAPGVRSARFAGPDCSSEDNIRKLMDLLAHTENRFAQFRTIIAYFDGKEMHCFEGTVKGSITRERAGSGGFGYDPIFLPEGYTQTFAALSPEEKNAISHRGRAVRKFVAFLQNASQE